VLELFANEAASAIENARLHDESELRVRQRTDELAQALRRQAIETDKTRAIVESISDAVCVFDPDGKVILVNRATARVLGLEPNALMGRNLSEQAFPELSEKDGQMTAEMFQAARSARQSLANGDELVNTAFEAARRVIRAGFSSVALQEGEPLTVVAVFRDITEEAELDRMKSEFISMAAHELRTPMTSITSYVDLLMLGMLGPVTPRQTEFLQVVKTNARRLMTLVSDLLDLERMESEGLALDLRPTSLSDVVAEVTLAMHRQIEAKGQVLTVDVPSNMPKAMVDRDRMIQVVTNLLSNAHKYSPDGAQIAISGQHENGHLMIQVRDAGIGISATDQRRLFTRFFRTDDAVLTQESGTGLGLAICHEIIKRHHGEIRVESEVGKGSTFRLVLPVDASIKGKAQEKDAR
jgi:PAS domain S-box-containing protein